MERLAPAVFVDDLRSEGVGMKACSDESLDEIESTGEGRPEEGAREEPLLAVRLRLLGETVEGGIWRPRRVGELLFEFELFELLSVESGESARSSASSGNEGEMGV